MCDVVSQLNLHAFKAEFEYGKCMQEALSSPSCLDSIVLSRVEALGISVICACALAMDIVYATYHTLMALGYAIIHLDSPLKYTSQARNILVFIVEFIRHLGGALAGAVIGIVSPQLAKDLFLPPDQSAISHDFTPENVAKTYKMLQVIDEVFSQAEIEYAMISGTQLGAQRHGGIFGWDDDGDLLMLKQDEDKLLHLKTEFNKRGLLLKKCDLIGYKLCDASGALSAAQDGNFGRYHLPFVDLSFARKEKGRISYDDPIWREVAFPNEYFTEEEWNNREEWSFGPITMKGVAHDKAEEWCSRVYGMGCLDVAYSRAFSHTTFSLALPRKVALAKDPDGHCPSAPYDANVFRNMYQRQEAIDPKVAALQQQYDTQEAR